MKLFPFGGIKLCFVEMGRISRERIWVESGEQLQVEVPVWTKPWEWVFQLEEMPF